LSCVQVLRSTSVRHTALSSPNKSPICRVGQNHIYTVHIRYLWQGNHQIYGHIRCIYTVLANPTYLHAELPFIKGLLISNTVRHGRTLSCRAARPFLKGLLVSNTARHGRTLSCTAARPFMKGLLDSDTARHGRTLSCRAARPFLKGLLVPNTVDMGAP